MYVVIGVWEMDPELRDVQRAILDQIVAGVGRLPGIVTGFWAEAADPARSHTFIVFADRPSAEAFAAEVRGNLENQARAGVTSVSLEVAEVTATT